MSKDNKRVVYAIISLFLPIVGIILFFVYKPRKDARLFGLLGVLSIIFWGFSGLNLF